MEISKYRVYEVFYFFYPEEIWFGRKVYCINEAFDIANDRRIKQFSNYSRRIQGHGHITPSTAQHGATLSHGVNLFYHR